MTQQEDLYQLGYHIKQAVKLIKKLSKSDSQTIKNSIEAMKQAIAKA